MEGIETTAEWRDAEKLFAEYVRVNDIKPGGFLVQQEQISKNTLHALIRTYVGESRSFTYDSQRGPAQAEKLPIELDSPTVEFHSVLTLDGFAALRAFDLSPIIQIRPVSQADLRVLNELHLAPFPSGVFGWPSTGWWVADFKVLNRRGGLVEVNGVYEHHEALTLALRAFKEGGCNVRLGYTTAVSPLQETGIIQGGLAERLSSLHSTYSISEEEIPRLVEFWKRFESLIHKADHYLQASVRRLRTAGGRHQREDALVDFVIGLESLLQYGKCGRWWRNFV